VVFVTPVQSTVRVEPRVLVVEDSEALRFTTRLVLEAAGWEVAEAATAAGCLWAMDSVDPDVVLLDLGLPDADGFSVLAHLKSQESTAWVPVVVLSGRSDRAEVSRLLLAGAQDYLVKPFTAVELHARLVAARRVALQHRLLAYAERRGRVAFDSAPVAMAEVDLDGRYLKVNGALCELFGYRDEDLVGAAVCSICHPDDVTKITDAIAAMAAGEMNLLRDERRFIHASGRAVWVAVSAAPVLGDGGHVSHLLTHYLDITDRKRAERQLEHLVDHDPLTGLLNRRGFEAELDRHFHLMARCGPSGALLVIDLDHFKSVNDTLGHNAGDEVIVSVAETLRRTVRGSDVVARLGGDEFAVILPHASPGGAEVVADKIVRVLRDQAKAALVGGAPGVTASVGVALFDDQHSGEAVLLRADHSMYEAKQLGRDRFAVHRRPDVA
jgi:diguanylate cyclase (GGDEF)-like protein/PAS domain S-box-containing protein